MPTTPRKPRRPGPVDPTDTIDPPPIDPIALYKALFSALDPDLPLALLPVRIETRFSAPLAPPELIVRLYPDAIHADSHQPGLTSAEQALAKAFWERSWRSGGDVPGKDAAFAWLASQVGAWRAAWLARTLAPSNPAAEPTAPVPDDQPLKPAPRFPELEPRQTTMPTYARLLPLRFAVAGYVDGELAGTWFGAPIPPDLPLAPALVDAEVADAEDLLNVQGLNWLHDIDAAIAVGMALRIDLSEVTEAGGRDGFDRLLVFGICADDQREALEALLDAHRYGRGLELAPQGMPTNRTETARDALHPGQPELAALRVAELEAPPAPARPTIAADGDLYRLSGADAASVALGLGKDNALDRTLHAKCAQLAWAEAMNRGLWPAALGAYLRELVGGLVGDEAQAWLRDWSTAFVRGGACLPTLLVGPQPYGVLPVSRIDEHNVETPQSNLEYVEHVVAAARGYWQRSLPGVAHLDPNVADAPDDDLSEGDLAATVSQVLGSVPHPTGLQLRSVEAKRDDYADAYGFRMFLLALGCSQFPDQNGNVYADQSKNPAALRFQELEANAVIDPVWAFTEASFDFHHTSGMNGVDFTAAQLDHYKALAATVDEQLLPLVSAHADRVAPVAPLLIGESSDVSFRVDDEDDPQAFFAYHGEGGTESPWETPLVAGEHTETALAEVLGWLRALAARLETGAPADDQDGAPLLSQLLDVAIDKAENGSERDQLATALATLQELVEGSDDPLGELERLLRETLGTASYRLDAWYTAVAAWRLENRRAKKARGLQVGAYGCVFDVRRRTTRASQGYIAAPSLPQATTAAVLRAGWSALGGSSELAGLNVNLSSDRLRRAGYLLDGVRRGQDLGRLLGSRLERRLHDAGLDTWIEPLRALALDATDMTAAPTGIVDGLLLARANSGIDDLDAAETAARVALNALLKDPERPAGNPTPTLDDLVHDLDAAADALSAQSVHDLARGSLPAATASLTASSSGEITPPPLTFADTPRPSLQVHHRFVVLVDPDATGSWPAATTSARALAAPAVEAWAEGLLGDPQAVDLTVCFVDAASGKTTAGPFARTLADTNLAALDLLALGPSAEETGPGRIGDALTVWGETLRPEASTGSVVVDTDVGLRSLADVVLAARSLDRLLAHSRDLDARDLVEPRFPVASGVDPDELVEREDAVRAALTTQRGDLAAAIAKGARSALRAALAPLVGCTLPGALVCPDAAALDAHAASVLAALAGRLSEHDRARTADDAIWDSLDADARAAALGRRLRLLTGRLLPLAPRFAVVNGEVLDASAGRNRAGDSASVCAWLNQAGRVDPAAHRLRVAIDLCEAVADRSLFAFRLAQLPDHADEGWAATTRPTVDERGRLCVLTTGATAPFTAGPLAGIVVGGFNEAIARTTPAAGIAVHFDASSSRAPQAILLCVARGEAGYDFGIVRDLVKQTLDLARLRMVGPETLLDLGQYLPAAYFPDTLSPQTTETAR